MWRVSSDVAKTREPVVRSATQLPLHYSSLTKQSALRWPLQLDFTANTPQADSSDTTVKTECKLGRTAVDRRTLAASAIRVWLSRACLARRLQRRRVRDLHLRWEPEIRRIAATRIQSVARTAARRRHLKRMGWAALEIQRAVRGWRARSIAKGLTLKMYVNKAGRSSYVRVPVVGST